MRRRIKLLAVILFVVLITGCSKGGNTKEGTTAAQTDSTVAETTTAGTTTAGTTTAGTAVEASDTFAESQSEAKDAESTTIAVKERPVTDRSVVKAVTKKELGYQEGQLEPWATEYTEYDASGNEIYFRGIYNYHDGAKDEERIYIFNEWGDIIRFTTCITYQGNSECTDTYYEYDENGNLILETYDDGMSEPELTYMEYDENNNMIAKNEMNGDEVWIRHIYEYDNNHNMLSEAKENSDGEIFDKRCYEYDENNNLIGCKIYYYGVIDTELGYNSDGEIIYQASYVDGELCSWLKYEWPDENTMVESSSSKENEWVTWSNYYKYEYDEQGNCISAMRYGEDGSFHFGDEWTYDEHGNIAKHIYHMTNGATEQQYLNEYDSNGNLTKCTVGNETTEYNDRGDIISYYSTLDDGRFYMGQEYEYQYFD